MKRISLKQVADLYQLQPWQREWLALEVRRGRYRRRRERSYLAQAEALFNRILRELSAGNVPPHVTPGDDEEWPQPPT